MTAWLTIGLVVALLGPGVIADSVDVDFPENVNSRLSGSRIVSGWEAEMGQHPWQCSLRMINPSGQVSACGGSVVHEDWVITAAHCTASRINFVLRIGVVNLTQPEYIYEASEFWNHPLYNNALPSVVQPHDIGVLKLSKPVTFTNNLKPIRIQRSADMNTNYGGQRLVASGYGLTWTGGTSPENLNWVYLLGTSYEECRNAFGGSSIIVPSTICGRYYNVTSQSTCQGDSGGPLSIQEQDGIFSLIGVASFVSGGGCHTAVPAGFIQPGFYHEWFYEVTGINFDWDWEPELSSEESAPQPSSEESAPQPSSEESAPQPSSEESAPQPSSEESAPQPSSEESAPQPSSEESAPQPSSEESAPQPSSEESAPQPSSEESAPQPSSEESAPRPSSEESAPRPSSEESAPRPSSEESAPRPSKESVQESSSDEPSEEDSNGDSSDTRSDSSDTRSDSSDTRSDSSDSRPESDSFGRM